MPPLADRQQAFARALLDSRLAPPPGLVGPDGMPSGRRFAVYRNNVVAGLIEALRDNYPAVNRIVGDDFFRAMAAAFAAAHPPQSPVMLAYGAGFPAFIAGFAPAAPLPYLADVARIERAWTEAYHAAEAAPIGPRHLLAIAHDDLPGLRLSLHPSLRLACSPFPALTVWRMNTGEGEPAPVDLTAGGEDMLAVRPGPEVLVHELPPGGAAFIATLAEGGRVVDAAIAGLAITPRFDLKDMLAGLVEAGAFVSWNRGSEAVRRGGLI